MKFASEESYLQFLQTQSALPKGFKASSLPLTFYPKERSLKDPLKMNLSLLELPEPTDSFAAVFTRNAFPGHPVALGKELLRKKGCRGILINNKIANVACPGGYQDSRTLVDHLASLAGGDGFYFPSSTGIIGWRLPVKEMLEVLPSLRDNLQQDSLLPLASGIMTTDRYPKCRTVKIGNGRITGTCKGAGMIEPNMATMLSFITTDIPLEKEQLQKALSTAVDLSFNKISIDSDQSTSDTVVLLSSGSGDPVPLEDFQLALNGICCQLAEDLVRNGEGTAHVIQVMVEKAPSVGIAAALGKALVNSPLTKTAIFGNDPNVGRFLQAIGDYCGNNGVSLDPDKLEISLGSEIVFSEGAFKLDGEKEKRLSDYLKAQSQAASGIRYPEHEKKVQIRLCLNMGVASSEVLGSDLSYEYVHENADYRT